MAALLGRWQLLVVHALFQKKDSWASQQKKPFDADAARMAFSLTLVFTGVGDADEVELSTWIIDECFARYYPEVPSC
jgi:hypothetical protein